MTSDISKRAEALASAHPLHEVLENAFFGVFHVTGRLTGYLFRAVNWSLFHSYTLIFVVWLAFQDGFRKTAKLEPKAKAVQPPPPPAPAQGQLLGDPRYADHTTPFGVPFGPNVHASHE